MSWQSGLNWLITRESFLNGVSRFLLSNRLREAMVRIPLGILLSIRRKIMNSGFTKRAKTCSGFTEEKLATKVGDG